MSLAFGIRAFLFSTAMGSVQSLMFDPGTNFSTNKAGVTAFDVRIIAIRLVDE